LTKFVYRYLPLAQMTVVEIEPAVVRMARQSFALPEEDARLEIVVADGVEYVAGTTQKFDLILVDGFNDKADPGGLNTLPFYQSCREKLNPDGVFGVNLLGLCRGVLGGFAHIHAAFDGRGQMFPPCSSGNTIAFATQGLPIDIALAELSARAALWQQNTGLNLLPTLARLAQSEQCSDNRLRF
jgi:spermidine synthase